MDVDRETLVEIVVSVGAVGLFIAVIMWVGHTFNESGLSNEGAIALVGAIIAFIVLMSVIGVGLAHYMNRE